MAAVGVRAADRLREPRQPAARSRRRPAARDGGPRGDGREPRRGCSGCCSARAPCWRRAGTVLGMLGAAWALDLMRASLPEELPYWMRLDVDVPHRPVHRCRSRSSRRSRSACCRRSARRGRRVVEDLKEGGRGASLGRPAQRTADRAGGGAGRAVPGAAGRRQPDDPQLPVAAARGHRLRRLADADDAGLPGRRRLRRESARARRSSTAALQSLRSLPGVTAVAATTSIPGDDGGGTVRDRHRRSRRRATRSARRSIATTPDLLGALGPVDGRRAARSPTRSRSIPRPASRSSTRGWRAGCGRTARRSDGASASPAAATCRGCASSAWRRISLYEELGEQTEQSQLNLYVPYALQRAAQHGDSGPRRRQSRLARAARRATRLAPLHAGLAGLRRPHDGGSAALHDVGAAVLRRDDGRVRRDGAAARLPRRLRAAGLCGAAAHARDRRSPRARRRAARRGVALRPAGAAASALLGLAIGLALALGVARLLSGQLFDVNVFDPWMFASTGGALLARSRRRYLRRGRPPGSDDALRIE